MKKSPLNGGYFTNFLKFTKVLRIEVDKKFR